MVDRYLVKPSDVEDDLVDFLTSGKAIVPQIDAYAAKYGIVLERGWKVDVARRVKSRLLRTKEGSALVEEIYVKMCVNCSLL